MRNTQQNVASVRCLIKGGASEWAGLSCSGRWAPSLGAPSHVPTCRAGGAPPEGRHPKKMEPVLALGTWIWEDQALVHVCLAWNWDSENQICSQDLTFSHLFPEPPPKAHRLEDMLSLRGTSKAPVALVMFSDCLVSMQSRVWAPMRLKRRL